MVTAKLYLGGALAALIVILALSTGLFLYRGQAIAAKAEKAQVEVALATALSVNETNKATIDRLTTYRAIDDKLMIELNGRLTGLATQADAAQRSVRELEKINANVAAYLASTLPDELKRVLNRPENRN